ncbi:MULTISPECIES: hypothetical protein [Halorussus]|uniref:hypothetical protein n=1 Tax=Halorussus TaxID=1070314 RepID=UPI000E216F56|nr:MULTISPECIES: hypothetical protein [Halorussus]NHN58777.1 hypothetical protein [Halorussus sp. JP-T4]
MPIRSPIFGIHLARRPTDVRTETTLPVRGLDDEGPGDIVGAVSTEPAPAAFVDCVRENGPERDL